MTNRKFFKNTTITTAEDIKNMISTFHAFHFVNDERAQAIAEMTAIVDGYNAELKATAVATIANSEDILTALIPSFTIDEKTAKSDSARKRAVLNAVSYVQYKVNTEKREIRATVRAVTVRDIFAYKCNLLASGHADRKVTKADREKARKEMMTTAQADALRLFMVGAYRFENVCSDIVKEFNYSANADEYALFITATPSKANAEKQIKTTASACGLGEIQFKRDHALTLYKRAYTIDKGHQAKVADIIDFMQDFTISARYAKNGIELPKTNDRAGIFATEDSTEDSDSVWKF